jgi:integrase
MSARKSDLDIKASTLAIPGGKSRAARRVLHLTPKSLEIFTARVKTEGPWLFPSERYPGNHITKLNNSHDRACIAAGVSFVLYDLRHTFGTRQATELKTDPFTLAAIMGHSNLRTTRPEGAKRGNGTLRHRDDAAQAEAGQVDLVSGILDG